MKVVALVPIKLNSQRVPGKNIRDLAGRPLLWYVCNTLVECEGIDEVCVYCSDEAVTQYLPEAVSFVQRPTWLDADDVKGAQIYSEFINQIDADIYVLVHTTSPFLKKATVERGIAAIRGGEFDSAFTAQRVQTFVWYNGSPLNYSLDNIPRTQDIEPVWVETSGFYMFMKELFITEGRRIGYKPFIVEVDNVEAIDIDEEDDFAFAELVATIRAGKGEKDGK